MDNGGSLGTATDLCNAALNELNDEIDRRNNAGCKVEYEVLGQGTYRCECGQAFANFEKFAKHATATGMLHRLRAPGGCTSTPDPINHPPHYTFGEIEVIDAIEDWGLSFHQAQVLKYVVRSKHKGKELEDLRKARWFLDRLIGTLEKK